MQWLDGCRTVVSVHHTFEVVHSVLIQNTQFCQVPLEDLTTPVLLMTMMKMKVNQKLSKYLGETNAREYIRGR